MRVLVMGKAIAVPYSKGDEGAYEEDRNVVGA